MSKSRKSKPSIYESITANIVGAIEAGAGDWQMPWHAERLHRPQNALTEKPYSGINTVSLWIQCLARGFESNRWATYKQWEKLGKQVCKGEKSSHILIYRPITEETPSGEERVVGAHARTAHVFNAEQLEDYDKWLAIPDAPVGGGTIATRIEAVEQFIANTGARVEIGGGRAYYRNADDLIHMPDRKRFFETDGSTISQAWYSTLLHELTHWTRHETRCNRVKTLQKRDYAFEELVAELGAAYLCADLGVANTPRPDHAQYIASWLRVLQNDVKAIFKAAALAEEAVRFLNAAQLQAN